MTIQQVIEKAIEGGWYMSPKMFYRAEPSLWKNDTVKFIEMPLNSIFDDPLFWQSLGKAMGFNKSDEGLCSVTGEWEKLNPAFLADCIPHREATMRWDILWHRFIDHLAEGKSIESFFESL